MASFTENIETFDAAVILTSTLEAPDKDTSSRSGDDTANFARECMLNYYGCVTPIAVERHGK